MPTSSDSKYPDLAPQALELKEQGIEDAFIANPNHRVGRRCRTDRKTDGNQLFNQLEPCLETLVKSENGLPQTIEGVDKAGNGEV